MGSPDCSRDFPGNAPVKTPVKPAYTASEKRAPVNQGPLRRKAASPADAQACELNHPDRIFPNLPHR